MKTFKKFINENNKVIQDIEKNIKDAFDKNDLKDTYSQLDKLYKMHKISYEEREDFLNKIKIKIKQIEL